MGSLQVANLVGKLVVGKRGYRLRPLASIKRIVVHHAGNAEATAESMAVYHVMTKGWPGIGYHYVVGRCGRVWRTAESAAETYHAHKYNATSLGVCLLGNLEKRQPSTAQVESTVEILARLGWSYAVRDDMIQGHRELPGEKTLCPGACLDMSGVRKAVDRERRSGRLGQEVLPM